MTSRPALRRVGMEHPRAVAVLTNGHRRVVLGSVDGMGGCGLPLVDDLLRLQLLVGRLGWSLRLEAVQPELRELFELVGLVEDLDAG